MVAAGSSGDRFLTLATESEGQVRERASRFLAFAFPIVSEQAFKERAEAIAKEHHRARHHCYAWVLGPEGERTRAHDAAEPAGTAGRPILRPIQGAGLTDCAVVVARYFGGTLLGKGGLVRAYGDAAAVALAANTIVEKVIVVGLHVRCGHDLVGAIRNDVLRAGGHVLHGTFAAACEMTVAVPRSLAGSFARAWCLLGAVVDQLK